MVFFKYPAILCCNSCWEACDLKWLWKITQAPRSPCTMPPKMLYLFDPYKIIMNYKSRCIHPSKSKLQSLSCGSVFNYLYPKEPLDGLHDSLVDCKNTISDYCASILCTIVRQASSLSIRSFKYLKSTSGRKPLSLYSTCTWQLGRTYCW